MVEIVWWTAVIIAGDIDLPNNLVLSGNPAITAHVRAP